MLRSVLFRVAAGVLGLCLVLLVSEVGLRIGSAILGPGTPKIPPILDDEIRITCIGESTTFGTWPAQLEELLNADGTAPRFRVINRGVVGIRTDGVANQLDTWLDEDSPKIAITMLGINDEGNVLVYPRGDRRSWWVEHVMTFRLLDLLWRSSSDRNEPEVPVPAEEPSAEAHLDPETRSILDGLEKRRPEATRRFRHSEMIEIHRDLLIEDPGTPVYHLAYLIGLVLHHDSPERIDEFFREETGTDPATIQDAERHRLIADWVEATGDRFSGRRLTASIAYWRRDHEAERRALTSPSDDPVLEGLLELRLADISFRSRSSDEVRSHMGRADAVLPDDYSWSLLLGALGFRFEEYDLATEHFEHARESRPDLPASHELVLLGRLANAYEQSGDVTRAARLRAEREEFELDRFREFTRYHYRRVVNALRARDIQVIAMQYPLLSVSSLRKLLDNREDVVYLENRENFEDALRDRGYNEIFVDHFAGAFGHFSNDGNMLIADNAAKAVRALIARGRTESDDAETPRTPTP